jgi:hypothetical protein
VTQGFPPASRKSSYVIERAYLPRPEPEEKPHGNVLKSHRCRSIFAVWLGEHPGLAFVTKPERE